MRTPDDWAARQAAMNVDYGPMARYDPSSPTFYQDQMVGRPSPGYLMNFSANPENSKGGPSQVPMGWSAETGYTNESGESIMGAQTPRPGST
jgi:hypothetical protein